MGNWFVSIALFGWIPVVVVGLVNVIFGDASQEGCSGVDADDDGSVTISDLIAAIAAALTGCGPDATFGGPASS